MSSFPLAAGVLLLWAAANLPDPTEPTGAGGRRPPHFAFGRGIHFCIGAPVARMEARLGLGHLLSATSSITLDPDHPPTRRPSIFLRRHRSLPIVVEPS